MTKPYKIVVGYDFSQQADLALERALWLATGFDDAEVHVVSGLGGNSTNADFPKVERTFVGADAIRDRLAAVLRSRVDAIAPRSLHGFVHTWLERGDDAILARDIHADLIVVGTHSKRGLARVVIGSTSERVVRDASCPVLVVRETTWPAEVTGDIQPPCRGCVAKRQETRGASWWCELHDHAPPYTSPLRSHFQVDMERARRLAWPLY